MAKIRSIIRTYGLSLKGKTVYTEAATGYYAVTPVIAAMAGAAAVYALARDNRFARAAEAVRETRALAKLAGVAGRVRCVTRKDPAHLRAADIITNSGNVRPIDAATIECLKSGAVIPLMYESWEFRGGDVDLAACRRRNIPVAGTDEHHPKVRIFPYLGLMLLRQLIDAGIEVLGSRIAVISDNEFGTHLARTLRANGAFVNMSPSVPNRDNRDTDAIVIACTPGTTDIVGGKRARLSAARIRRDCPVATVIQFWGEIDRAALKRNGVPYYPAEAPARGHMAVLPSDIGGVPIIKLQAAGLKVGELLSHARQDMGLSATGAVTYSARKGFGRPLQ